MTRQLEMPFGSSDCDANDGPPITYVPQFLSIAEQGELLAEVASYALSSPQIQVFGKRHPIPRQQIWFADPGCDYRYSKLLLRPDPWPDCALKLRLRLNREVDARFNGCLVNHYRDGNDAMGLHADNEPELLPTAPVAIVSVGEHRSFIMRRNLDGLQVRLVLQSGDLLLMHPPMQALWQHGIPRQGGGCGARTSFTFRAIIPGYHRR